jgi:hypothetical protein
MSKIKVAAARTLGTAGDGRETGTAKGTVANVATTLGTAVDGRETGTVKGTLSGTVDVAKTL